MDVGGAGRDARLGGDGAHRGAVEAVRARPGGAAPPGPRRRGPGVAALSRAALMRRRLPPEHLDALPGLALGDLPELGDRAVQPEPAEDRLADRRAAVDPQRAVELAAAGAGVGRGPELGERALGRGHAAARGHPVEELAPEVAARSRASSAPAGRCSRAPGGRSGSRPRPRPPRTGAAARSRSGSWRASTGRRPSRGRSCPRGAGWRGRSRGPCGGRCWSRSPPAPPGRASSAGSSRAVSTQWPRWLTPSCISKPSSVRRSGCAIRPALLTRMSMRSCSARTASAAARTEPASRGRAGRSRGRPRGARARISLGRLRCLLLVAGRHHHVRSLARRAPARSPGRGRRWRR